MLALHQKILQDMLSIPTAPFAEHAVIDYVRKFCQKLGTPRVAEDKVGNLLVHIRQGNRKVTRPVCITAHLDHPGFIADRMLGGKRLRAFWRGGVPKEYFVGTGVRFYTDGGAVKGRIRSIKTVDRDGQKRVDTCTVELARAADVPHGTVGMWDLPDPQIRNGRIHARGCDDIAGASAMLCAMESLVRRNVSCDTYYLFTRAEEVGFIGAIAAARLKTIPKKCLVVAMENSSQLPNARMGDGPILRVGDRASTFTPAVTSFCHRVARELASTDSSFKYQRKLMDGGTCESSAYCVLGYEATGMCLALGNYHNIDAKRRKIAPEFIDLSDFENVVKWFVELARTPHAYAGRDDVLYDRIIDLEKTYRTLLRRSVRKPA
ncbi:MAG: M20/M25/M40 family metallo-hydrolase [Phycisphaerae bacterium]|nr:M20/M25/M40 family metallo-hydrolase [Phycisphaerae bacterium]